MDKRKQKILWAVVQDYINTAEPVGSRTIARKYDLGVSPATVRNEMADLDELGYLEQPYTSAGRVPSQQGYRYYVDNLMQPETPGEEEKKLINVNYQAKVEGISEVIESTGLLLSQLTSCAAIISAPRTSGGAVRHLRLLPLEAGKAMVLIVTEPENVHARVIELPQNISSEDLETISEVMNAKIKGRKLSEIRFTIIRELYMELLKHKAILEYIMELVEDSEASEEDKIYLGGIINILNQPEFRNAEKVKTLLSLLDQEELLSSLLAADQEEEIAVRIGDEFKSDIIRGCSVVSAKYTLGGGHQGTMAVLGPSRMQYARVTGLLQYLTRNIAQLMQKM